MTAGSIRSFTAVTAARLTAAFVDLDCAQPARQLQRTAITAAAFASAITARRKQGSQTAHSLVWRHQTAHCCAKHQIAFRSGSGVQSRLRRPVKAPAPDKAAAFSSGSSLRFRLRLQPALKAPAPSEAPAGEAPPSEALAEGSSGRLRRVSELTLHFTRSIV